MTPEAALCLAAARQSLADAESILALPIPRIAAREAYMAAFHAAEALVIERTGKLVKTHSGLRTAFARVGRDIPAIDRNMTTFLANAFRFKSLSDYDTTRTKPITTATAGALIEEARAFVARVEESLGENERQ
jgi:uncharacterized protein (UPF0332 family)